MSPVPSEKRLQNFKRPSKGTYKSLTGSNIISSKSKRISTSGFDFKETVRMQTPRKSPKSTNKITGKSQICTSNKILSAKLKRRLKMIKALSDSVGEEPVVKVCSSSISECFKCSICNGYLYKATTITECLHTFCKSCIVKHFTFNLNCPKCNILIHPTDPLVNLRSDSIIQDLLYKLLPGVEKEEKTREQSFLAKMQSPGLPSIKAEKKSDIQEATKFLQYKKISKKRRSKDMKSEPKDIHVGFEINLLGCCTENFTTKPPLKAYFSLPISSTMKDAQNFLEERLEIPPETQVIFFVGGYLINPLLGVEKLWSVFSNGDVLENFLSLSYAIMPLKDYFNVVENCDS